MSCDIIAYIYFITLVILSAPSCARKDDREVLFSKGKICIGTSGRMSVPANRANHYQNLRDRYSNCTYVDGNLELTWLQDGTSPLDLGFLSEIREVTGYVLVSHVVVKRIALPQLAIIRGRSLFKLSVREEPFALMVTLNRMEVLELPALQDILAGSVGFFNNYNLCYIRTIRWDEILSDSGAKNIYVSSEEEKRQICPKCDRSCERGCWGSGPANCQRFSKINCSPQCHQGRCFGPNPRECCHLFCAGGCTGPTQSDCLACRNFYDNGVCKQECPPMMRYNPSTYSWETNPFGKYAYGATCVKTCPEHLLRDSGACVRSCPLNKHADNGECVPCDGPCPKKCEGVEVVHAGNIDSFKGCTIIEGSLTILDSSFNGFQEVYPDFTFGPRYSKMHPDKLEVFSTLQEVTGYVSVQADAPHFTNLSYFRNLEVIGGRQLTEYFAALYIVKSSLESFNLRSLRKLNAGSIAIIENPKLCYADNINWRKVMMSSSHGILLQGNGDQCQQKRCDEECTEDGCWGPGPDQCLGCRSFKLGNTCVPNCHPHDGIYDAGNNICKRCHPECDGVCNGQGSSNCTRCKHAKDGPFCVRTCPLSKYEDADGMCKPCHPTCVGGCTGPYNLLGFQGCNSCNKILITTNSTETEGLEYCMKPDEACPEGFYQDYLVLHEDNQSGSNGKSVCRKCHQRCKNCSAYGFHVSVCTCLQYSSSEQCQEECPSDHYADERRQLCVKCEEECRGCHGPSSFNCTSCRNFRLYRDDTNHSSFNCTSTCPPEKPYKVYEENLDPYCSLKEHVQVKSNKGEDQSWTTIAVSISVIIIFLGFFGIFSYICLQRAKTKEKTAKISMVQRIFDEEEPLKPTDIKPNLAKLLIVKEAELRKGGVLGGGAFGTVYQGVWIPENENVKIPVAIKVVREGTGSDTNKEFLEEAYLMASVDHPNVLKLIAVCLASQIMLVTQLMPLGCLLDYVRNNKNNIGSKPLLNWCAQIARGMAYLEEKRMVHRDLALRNVLLHTPGCVKITDFGLAKFLDFDEDEYKSSGGKMPIKWLALECIQHRIFTHKSDVWAFGVTIWELLSYGERPYEHLSSKQVPELLEKGERLPQPLICTIDVYMIMIKCWMVHAESRPSFSELSAEFTKMARDPGRYLVIKGDSLMRLPSYTPQDERELIQTLSNIEGPGPERVMDAEEYMQPRYHYLEESPPPPTPIKKFMEDRGFDPEPVFNFGNTPHYENGDAFLVPAEDSDGYLLPSNTQAHPNVPKDSVIQTEKPLALYLDLISSPDPKARSLDNPEYHRLLNGELLTTKSYST